MSRIVTYSAGMAPLGECVACIGVFDGVHIGHAALVRDAVVLAHTRGVASVVVTFDRDPDRVVDPDHAAPQLLELDDKLELLEELGPDVVLVVPFTPEVAALTPQAFLDSLLLAVLTPRATLVGHDFRFGARASGDLATLEAYGVCHAFAVIGHPLVAVDAETVTSTRIRRLIAEGRLEDARRLLGRPHRLTGRVVAGRGEGKALGAATANLEVPTHAAVPKDGVYAARVEIDGVRHPAAVAVGAPPTFAEAGCAIEAHVLDFSGDLYGRDLRLEFLARLRDLERFSSAERLSRAIADDVRLVREIVTAED